MEDYDYESRIIYRGSIQVMKQTSVGPRSQPASHHKHNRNADLEQSEWDVGIH